MKKINFERKREIEPEEILFESQRKKEEEFKSRLEIKIEKKVFNLIFILALFLIFAFFGRQFFLFLQKDFWIKESQATFIRSFPIIPPRGLILTKEGEVLVENVFQEVFLDGGKFKREVIKRRYKDPQIFSPILGYLGEVDKTELSEDPYYTFGDSIGKSGVEKSAEKYLRGEKGKIEKVVNAFGEVLEEFTQVFPPKEGFNVILNISGEAQRKLYEIIQRRVPQKKVAALVFNPQNGKILALVSLPSDDTNIFLEGSLSQADFQRLQNENKIFNPNRVISGRYPSGSTIKPLILLSALEEGIVSTNTQLNCPGFIEIPNPYGPSTLKKCWRVHGKVDIFKAIAESCNVFFFTLGGGTKDFQGLGIERIKKYLQKFFLEKELGIDLPGEKVGFVPTPEWFEKERKSIEKRNWSIADVYDVSIGQGYFLTTPLHLAFAVASIVNGGKILKPQVIDKIVDKNGKIIKEFQPEILAENIAKKENLEIVKKAMEDCVNFPSGTCHKLKDLPVSSGGKTGTAESSVPGKYFSWYLGFAPAKNPEVFIQVLVEESEGGERGAIPIAKEFLEWYFQNKATQG
jgi:penicillin-binding protein 2